VKYTYPNGEAIYYIYPRYIIDDLFYYDVIFKPDTGQNTNQQSNSNTTLLTTYVNFINKFLDRQFEIIYEDINNPIKFDYETFITSFNSMGTTFGLKYDTKVCTFDKNNK
jgi:hypothetical protein